MRVKILREEGFKEALLGLGLSYGLTDEIYSIEELLAVQQQIYERSLKLYDKGEGHSKFLESIQVWLDLTLPRSLWSEYDTYRVGTSKQSQSTMHTLSKKPFNQNMFEMPIPPEFLSILERQRVSGNPLSELKNLLPEGFLQRRIVSTNYGVLRNILKQRKNHKLQQWKDFCQYIYENVQHPEYFFDIFNK